MRKKEILNFMVFAAFVIGVLFISLIDAFGQRSNSLQQRCAGQSPVVPFAKVEVQRDGDIDIVPCSTKNLLLNGSPINVTGLASLNGLVGSSQTFAVGAADTAAFSSATSTHTLNLPITGVSGSSRTNYFPYFNSANTIAKSPFNWNGTEFTFLNTALDSKFELLFKPDELLGQFRVGDLDDYFSISKATNSVDLFTDILTLSGLTSATVSSDTVNITGTTTINILSGVDGITTIGDNGVNNKTQIIVNDGSNSIGLFGNLLVNTEVAPAAGNATINKTAGLVMIDANADTLTLTNGLIKGDSIILLTPQTLNNGCTAFAADADLGGVIIRANTPCTASTGIYFLVLN